MAMAAAANTTASLLSLSSALKHCSLSSPSPSPSLAPSFSSPPPLKPSPLTFTLRRKAPFSVAVATETDRGLSIFDEEEDGEEELRLAYEALYGPAFSGLRKEGEKVGRRRRGGGAGRDEFEERVVEVKRVTKVVKGGKQLSFRAIVVIGDKKGQVGVGVGSAKEVVAAVQKSSVDAKRHIVAVPLTKARTFPHRAEGKYGAAKVMLRPAATGTGVIAGGSVRVVLEMAGVENALGKEIGSKNALNNARAVIEAISQMKTFEEVSARRGIPMEELWK